MKNNSSTDTKDKSTELPAPELLKPKSENESSVPESASNTTKSKPGLRLHRATYRPSHKATFIGLAVVAVILAINAGIITFVMRIQDKAESSTSQGQVTISSSVLDKLGVSRNTIGSSGAELTVGLNSRFSGNLAVNGNTNMSGQLNVNSKLLATDASLTKLEAGDTSLSQLNVSGDGTLSSLNLRKDLIVVGTTRLQGPVTVSQLMTVNNNMNVSGSLAVGGALSMGAFQTNTLTVGGHITTRGSAPSVGVGPAVGNNGTVSISGNDVSGTVAVNTGTGAGNGVLAYVTFNNQFSNIPHVTIGAIGYITGAPYILNRTASGFTIGINGALSPGGYMFDYIVMQ